MLIIFTGEKDDKKQKTNKQNLFVEKKKEKEKAGGKKSPECGRARLLFSVLYVRK